MGVVVRGIIPYMDIFIRIITFPDSTCISSFIDSRITISLFIASGASLLVCSIARAVYIYIYIYIIYYI